MTIHILYRIFDIQPIFEIGRALYIYIENISRKYQTVKRWSRQTIKEHTSKRILKFSAESCSLKSKANIKYIAVCGPKRTNTLGPQDLICPTCRKTIRHQSCLELKFQDEADGDTVIQ